MNLQLMRLLDEEYTRHSFKGVLGRRDCLRLQGHSVNEKRVRRLLRLMSLEAAYPKPRLSAPGEGVTSYPYLHAYFTYYHPHQALKGQTPTFKPEQICLTSPL